MKSAFRIALLLVCATLFASSASAQNPYSFFDYKERLRAAEMAPAGHDAFGERISLFNGATEFAATDVDLPGNNQLPVRIGRRFVVDEKFRGLTAQGFDLSPEPLGGFGGWDIDIPYIHAVVDATYGWAASGTGHQRCSSGLIPRVTSAFEINEIFQGAHLHIPWAGDQELTRLSGHPLPSDGQTYPWGTRDLYRVSCVGSVVNYPGEGFLVVDTSGNRYTFNVAVIRDAGYAEKPVSAEGSVTAMKQRIYLFVSRIEDRFGNHVTYHYTGEQLTRIASSDGREIQLHWGGNGVDRITAHGREWRYVYGADAFRVILPDGSSWQYRSTGDLAAWPAGLQDGTSGDRRCLESLPGGSSPFSMSVTHPAGATAVFDFAYGAHRRSGTPASACSLLYTDSNTGTQVYVLQLADYAHTYSIVRKEITGPGLPRMTWSYGYEPPQTGRANFLGSSYCSACDHDKSTFVVNPDDSVTEHLFGALWNHNEGIPLGSRTRNAAGQLVREELLSYVTDAEARTMPFNDEFGIFTLSDNTAVLKNRPLKQKTINQDGVSFRSSVASFDHLARPLSTTKSSTLAGNPTKTETTVFHDNTAKWILGQTARTTVNGIVASETGFDAHAQPISFTQFGRTVQTLGYDVGATIESGQRGMVRTVTDGNGKVTTVSGWKRGIPQTIRYPALPEASGGATTTAAVNDHGWIASVTDENGFVTSYGHDPMGRITSITPPSGDTVAWAPTVSTYERVEGSEYGIPAGHWGHTVTTGNARRITYLDGLWRPLVVREYDSANAAGTQRFTRTAYDHEGRTRFSSYPGTSDALAAGTRTSYDALGRPSRVEQDSELGVLVTTTEYLAGFQTRVTPPRGAASRTTTSFLAWDQPTTEFPAGIAHPTGAFTDIARDVFGKPTAITRRNSSGSTSLSRRFVYSGRQLLCKMIEPETGATVMEYDQAGNLLWSAAGTTLTGTGSCNVADVPSGQRITRTYDGRNWLRSLTFPDGPGSQTWAYTRDGLPSAISTRNSGSGDVVTNNYAYNKRRLLEAETFGVNGQLWSLGYGYNAAGHLASLVSASGLAINYAPNALGQPSRAGAYATAVGYHPNGGMQQFTYGNGLRHQLTQNLRGLPDTSCDYAGSSCGAGAILHDGYDYDGHGNVMSISDGRSGQRSDRSMAYDASDRLIATTSPMFGTASYGYDVLDNLRTVAVSAGPRTRQHTYVYDATNRLTNVTNTADGATRIGLGYDVRGNMTNKNGVVHTFDLGNRLREVSGERYLYDGHGRRVLSVRGGQNLYSLYGQDGQLRFQRDERTGKTIDYVQLNGSLVAQVENPIALSTPVLTVPTSSTTGSFSVSWTAVALAARYELRERRDSGSWSTIHNEAGISRTLTGRAAGNWGYQVRACSAASCGGWSAERTVPVQSAPSGIPNLTVPATSTTGSYTVSWTAVAAATSYELQESVNGGTYTRLEDGAGLSLAVSGRQTGMWRYRVRACNPAGCGAYSEIKAIEVTVPASAVPRLTVPASSNTGNYVVSWTSVSGATRYELQERPAAGGWTTMQDASVTSIAITGRASGTWEYQVRACSTNCGVWSATASVLVTLPPANPPTLTVPASSNTGAYTVSWTAVATATRYELQERLGSGSWSTLPETSATTRAISGKTGGSWHYQVRACNTGGCTAFSTVRTVVVSLPPAGTPTLTVPPTGANGAFSVSWTTVSGATGYQLQERQGTGAWATVQDDAATSRSITGKAAGDWSYQVRACNSVGCAAWSSPGTVTVVMPPTGAPTLTVPANSSTGAYTVSWTGVAGATRYELQERSGTGAWALVHETGAISRSLANRTTGNWGYRVRACNLAGCASYSAERVVVVLLAPSGVPVLTLPQTSTGSFTVAWTTVATATVYELQERLGTGRRPPGFE